MFFKVQLLHYNKVIGTYNKIIGTYYDYRLGLDYFFPCCCFISSCGDLITCRTRVTGISKFHITV